MPKSIFRVLTQDLGLEYKKQAEPCSPHQAALRPITVESSLETSAPLASTRSQTFPSPSTKLRGKFQFLGVHCFYSGTKWGHKSLQDILIAVRTGTNWNRFSVYGIIFTSGVILTKTESMALSRQVLSAVSGWRSQAVSVFVLPSECQRRLKNKSTQVSLYVPRLVSRVNGVLSSS